MKPLFWDQAIRALGEMQQESVTPLLVSALKEPDPEVRRAAARALGEHK